MMAERTGTEGMAYFGGNRMKDLTGQRFGRLSVIQSTPERKDERIVWMCKCDCGVVFAGSSTLHIEKLMHRTGQ